MISHHNGTLICNPVDTSRLQLRSEVCLSEKPGQVKKAWGSSSLAQASAGLGTDCTRFRMHLTRRSPLSTSSRMAELQRPVVPRAVKVTCGLLRKDDTKMSVKKTAEELQSIFAKYAAKEGDPDQLSKEELKLLIQTEFPSLLKGPNTINELFQELDKNGDGEVSFEEFQALVKKISQ
ncbi:Protein S100-G [Galemys pyrenaicus]|uniref:Protein S100-G n=1 Tax=Galemys pyrenaicus TaxID=202257 RepID=A0A8J6A1B0_GALPY|nr:Protein S100-G [Galemys pyrenaicus]